VGQRASQEMCVVQELLNMSLTHSDLEVKTVGYI